MSFSCGVLFTAFYCFAIFSTTNLQNLRNAFRAKTTLRLLKVALHNPTRAQRSVLWREIIWIYAKRMQHSSALLYLYFFALFGMQNMINAELHFCCCECDRILWNLFSILLF